MSALVLGEPLRSFTSFSGPLRRKLLGRSYSHSKEGLSLSRSSISLVIESSSHTEKGRENKKNQDDDNDTKKMYNSTAGYQSRIKSDSEMTIYLIDAAKERAMLGGKRKLKVKAWATIRDVKFAIQRLLHIPAAKQRLYWRSMELRDHRTLEESGIHQSGSTLLFAARPLLIDDTSLNKRGEKKHLMLIEPVASAALHGAELPSQLARTLLKVRRALALNRKAPELALDGTGGTYFLFGLDGRPAACFKPADEEPFCINNPRHFVGPYGLNTSPIMPKRRITTDQDEEQNFYSKKRRHGVSSSSTSEEEDSSLLSSSSESEIIRRYDHLKEEEDDDDEDEKTPWLAMRKGVRPGEAYLREVATYLLDCSAHGLAGVPETTLAESAHSKFNYFDRIIKEKVGSLQVFAQHDGVAEDYGVDRLATTRIQAIAALDIRTLNCDRNPSNILVRRIPGKESLDLIPIDHGYCLPNILDIEWFDWCWLDWPQCASPLDDELRDTILAMDPIADVFKLRDALGLRSDCLRLAAAASLLLQLGVRAGLTLRDIASLIVVSSENDIHGVSADASMAISRKKIKSKLANSIDRAHELAVLALRDHRWRAHSTSTRNDTSNDAMNKNPSTKNNNLEKNVSSSSLVFSGENKEQVSLTISISPVKNAIHRAKFEEELIAETKVSTENFTSIQAAETSSDISSSPTSSSDDSSSPVNDTEQTDRHDSLSGGGGSLIRLRSCPALVDDENKINDEFLSPAPPKVDHRRLDPHTEADYDRQFFHFLKGLLDDLVRWKCHHRD